MEMLLEVGHCPGIENYARWFTGRKPGEPPYTLIDFFPEDFLLIVDESHVTLPQVRGMFAGDHSRKKTLVEHGFRLPSALDNRPLQFDEWEKRIKQVLFMSATPGPYELERTGGEVVEQVIRPTGLVDPVIHVQPGPRPGARPAQARSRSGPSESERVLVTTLTKRLAEDLTQLLPRGRAARASGCTRELDAIERVQILRELREGAFDVLVGVNLLREGLDLPEVSLVAILDADKEGFLRSETSLIQTIGRAARNVNAEVILYADKVTRLDAAGDGRDEPPRASCSWSTTPSTASRRETVQVGDQHRHRGRDRGPQAGRRGRPAQTRTITSPRSTWRSCTREMLAAAENLEFERAAAAARPDRQAPRREGRDASG